MKRNNPSDLEHQITAWLKSVLNTQQIHYEQLGNGLVYCLLMNHYYPTLMPIKKICLVPRKRADYLNNIRLLNQVFSLLKWTHFAFDINKIVSFIYTDNMQLLTKMYQMLNKNQLSFGKKAETISHNYGANNRNIHAQKPQKINAITYPPLLVAKPSSYTEKTTKSEYTHPQISSSTSLNMNIVANLCINSNSTTPLKNPLKTQSTVLDDIKGIVVLNGKTDRQKVNLLKNLLGIQVEQKVNYEQECEKDLLNDDSKKQSTIVIDDA